jgi:hypothetical protein
MAIPINCMVQQPQFGDLKLYSFHAKIFPSPEGHKENTLVNGGCCCTKDYAMERSPTGMQQRPR